MKIVLFDMDGTLTPPRKEMNWPMVDSLYNLQDAGFEIGIVSGSDIDYIKQQCNVMFDLSRLECTKIHWLPCNGTKYYKYARMQNNLVDFEKVYLNDMRAHIGETKWRALIELILNLQSAMARVNQNIPLSGTFLQYRGSTINWSPIGRSASDEDRKTWEILNANNNIRKKWLPILKDGFKSANLLDVTVKYGGETSFDIYPIGWDKTYAFRNFQNYEKIYFVGDRCDVNGNDYEAYELAGSLGYKTQGPEETIKIIDDIIAQNI